MRSEEAPEPCNLVTAVMARLLPAIVSSTELLSPVMCHVMCHESNLECKHCVTLIVLLLVPVTQTAAFFLISGDNIPGPGHWLPGHRYRDTPGYRDTVIQSIPGAGHWLPGHRYRDTPGYTDTVIQSMDTEQLPRPCT